MPSWHSQQLNLNVNMPEFGKHDLLPFKKNELKWILFALKQCCFFLSRSTGFWMNYELKLWEPFLRPIWILHSLFASFFTRQSPGIQNIFFNSISSTSITNTVQCTPGQRIRLFSYSDTVTHLFWTTQLELYDGEKIYFGTFPFIDIVNSCNFDPFRLIILRMKMYKICSLRWWISFSKWFIPPEIEPIPLKYSRFSIHEVWFTFCDNRQWYRENLQHCNCMWKSSQ